MEIRKACPADARTLGLLASRMWEHDPDALAKEFAELTASPECACFLAYEDGDAIGFAQCQLRHDYVEGCDTSPVGFLEGVYVEEGFRRSGAARDLLRACEEWARAMGCSEFASDCELSNDVSLAWHLHAGFNEVNRIICFAKKL